MSLCSEPSWPRTPAFAVTGNYGQMPKLLNRAMFASVALSQAKKFLASPRGQQVVAQAKAKASDPATRAKLSEFVGKVRSKA
jgi:hypothetical protein